MKRNEEIRNGKLTRGYRYEITINFTGRKDAKSEERYQRFVGDTRRTELFFHFILQTVDAFLWRFADGLRPSSRPLTILTQFSPNDGKTFRFREHRPKVVLRIRDIHAPRLFPSLRLNR